MGMKMKCTVIQDLLPSYADNICSEDTKELVREHMAECEQCKEKLERMRNTEIVARKASKKQVDYLKKIHSTITHKEGLGKVMLVILIGITYGGLFVGGRLLDYSRIPSLVVSALFFCAAVLVGNYRFSGGKAAVVEIGVSGAVFVFVAAFYEYFMFALMEYFEWDSTNRFPFTMMEMSEVGPFYVNILRIMATISVAVLLWNTFGKRKNAYATTLNITAISYIVYANDGLYHMDSPDTFQQWVNELTVIQIVLAVAGIVIYGLLQKFGKAPAETKSL